MLQKLSPWSQRRILIEATSGFSLRSRFRHPAPPETRSRPVELETEAWKVLVAPQVIFVWGHRPKTKELLELLLFFLLLLLSLFYSIWFISSLKGTLEKKILPSQDLNLGLPDPQSGTLPNERRHCYLSVWKLSTYFKNPAADLGPVLVDTCFAVYLNGHGFDPCQFFSLSIS